MVLASVIQLSLWVFEEIVDGKFSIIFSIVVSWFFYNPQTILKNYFNKLSYALEKPFSGRLMLILSLPP